MQFFIIFPRGIASNYLSKNLRVVCELQYDIVRIKRKRPADLYNLENSQRNLMQSHSTTKATSTFIDLLTSSPPLHPPSPPL